LSPARNEVLSINGLLRSFPHSVIAGLAEKGDILLFRIEVDAASAALRRKRRMSPFSDRGRGLARRWTLGSSPRVTMEVGVETGKPLVHFEPDSE
jgi:hypothetical protein